MFERVLVAADLSESCSPIVQEAIHLAQRYGAQLMLLHVLSTEEEVYLPYSLYPLMESYSEYSEQALERYEEEMKVHEKLCLVQLKSFQEQASALGVRAEISQSVGSADRTICDTAKDWNADLILLGNRGRRGLSEMLLGSVSNYVMHNAPCSVLIVKPNKVATTQERPAVEAVV